MNDQASEKPSPMKKKGRLDQSLGDIDHVDNVTVCR